MPKAFTGRGRRTSADRSPARAGFRLSARRSITNSGRSIRRRAKNCGRRMWARRHIRFRSRIGGGTGNSTSRRWSAAADFWAIRSSCPYCVCTRCDKTRGSSIYLNDGMKEKCESMTRGTLALALAAAFLNGNASAQVKGHPDFQGIWNSATATPLERPAKYKDKAFFTTEEAAELEHQAVARREDPAPEVAKKTFASYNAVFY